ncbi:hypothetical protein HF324_31250 [Chitinophaga oryzae]|uniref:Uncharacterized protein n=1 Tax=Chitinophaga oryzae TaxID=2725414 RepID=A0AAE7DA51_9BACT|nr:hypothetical protein [Chitinophaga oryzae]QJB35536.1 hypothetical protein HF329_31230 [Chitinophaga oryzae]QJB42079.1 hypothetical protein HF324_31250 [Chitinophaga oryzae]
MTKSLQVAFRGIILGSITLLATDAFAQLKVGNQPTKINRSSVLELESDRQGLLLPRLTSFTDIDALTPPDGMIVYYAPTDPAKAAEKGLYIRRNNAWEKMANDKDATANWKLTGNDAVAGNFIGTNVGSVPLVLKGQGVEGLIIDNGYTFLKKLDAVTAGVDVLLVDPATGKVSSRKISETAFNSAINSINGLTGPNQTLTTAGGTDYAFTSAGSDHKLTIVTQDGTKTVGLLSKADWDRLDKAAKALVIGGFNATPTTNGLSIGTDALGNPSLSLHAADENNPGALTAVAQTIGGNKTFKNNVIVDGSGTINNGLTVTGTTTLNDDAILKKSLQVGTTSELKGKVTLGSVATGTDADKEVLMLGATGEVIKKTLPTAAFRDFKNGSDGPDVHYTEDAATNSLTLHVPSASLVADRGLVTGIGQTFKGAKKFNDDLAVRTKVIVGDTLAAANSTLQVAGSLSLNIVSQNANYTMTDNDNTILMNCTSGDLTVTLLSAAGRKGRVITVKKIGGTLAKSLQIVTTGGEKIEDGTDYFIYNDWTFVTLQSDGANWFIIRH